MNLVPIQYHLEEYELPDHLIASGIIEVEIDLVDDAPYIYAFDLAIVSADGGRVVHHYYDRSRTDNSPNDVDLCKLLHGDKKLMDDIFDDCAREGMWE